MISGKSEKIERVFNTLIERNSDIKGFILVSYDGLAMISSFKPGILEDTISAMTAEINSLIAHFLKDLRWESFSSILISSSKEYIFIKDIKGIGLIATVIRSNTNWKKVYGHVNYIVSTIDSLDKPDIS